MRRGPGPLKGELAWLLAGSAAALVSAAVLMACGQIENRRPAGPINGPSQWIWGKRAARKTRADARRTTAGYLIHHFSSLLWTLVHEGVERISPPRSTPDAVIRGGAIAALAAWVDYRVTPRRFQPGFEQQLSRGSLLLTYMAFGITLGLTRHALRLRHDVGAGRAAVTANFPCPPGPARRRFRAPAIR